LHKLETMNGMKYELNQQQSNFPACKRILRLITKVEVSHYLCTEKHCFTLFKRIRNMTRHGNLHNTGTRTLTNDQEDAVYHIRLYS
jgi:hypothetical protein